MTTGEAVGSTPAAQPKRWPIALLVAVITGSVGGVIAVPVSDWAMEAHHVSTMEGGRACAAIGIWAPLAFIIGFATGFFVSLRLKGVGFVGYLKRQGISLVIIAAVVAAGGGLGYAAADHPPVIDGQNLALDIEVRVPTKGRSIEDLKAADFDVSLIVSASDRRTSDTRWSDAVRTEEFITVPAWAPLNSRSGGRNIYAGIRGETRQGFSVIRHGSPKQIDEEWSEWTPPRADINRAARAPEDQYLVRYRVRFASEYSPSPTPIPTPRP